jgi:AraC-like DNA-binding protein
MIEVEIIPNNSKDILQQMQVALGGKIVEKWSEYKLVIDNEFATGSISFIPFDWGVNLMEIDATFNKELILKIKANKEFNPLRFVYSLNGDFKHRFGVDEKEKTIEQFQSLIFTNKSGNYNYIHFPKNEKMEINVIQILRKKFLKKRTTNVSTLNKNLYEVFVDEDQQNQFAHFGQLNLKMADLVRSLRKLKGKGMLRILRMEAKVYEILSIHIQQHNRLLKGVPLPTSLITSELKIVRNIAKEIVESPSLNYSLDQLSAQTGLSQAKLQDGFKFLYNRTVTEYIRNIRLEAARDLLSNSDLNISQIVYTIGFTSRSYFSKIFREKFGVTPNQFKKKLINLVML